MARPLGWGEVMTNEDKADLERRQWLRRLAIIKAAEPYTVKSCSSREDPPLATVKREQIWADA